MKTEYTAIWTNGGVRVITEQEAKTNTTDNIYYLNWLANDYEFQEWKRASDDDIKIKSEFCIDIDFRNNCDFEITNEDIIWEWETLAEFLETEDEYFWEWNKIVFSGNGLHIYYKGTPRSFDKKIYSMWVGRIYKQWDKFMWDEKYKCDHACKNIARILRLPWSINQKNGAKVEILAERKKESRLFDFIESLAKKEMQEQEKEKEKRKKEMEEHLKTFWSDNKMYEEINAIPAYQIAQLLLPQFPYDGKKNFKNENGGYTWYFYNQETNTIVNWWSRYFNWKDTGSGWNNFSLIKNYRNYTNKETFEFFKKITKK